MTILIDSYNESNANSSLPMYSGSVVGGSQSFENVNSCNLNSCKAYLSKGGSPTGDIYAKLYAHSGTYGTSSVPTGVALATSEAVDISTVSTNEALVEFVFTGENQILLTASTYYTLVIEYSDGNSSNNLQLWIDSSSGHPGNFARYISDWSAQTWDMPFYVYGEKDFPVVGQGYPLTAFGNV